MLCRKHSQFVHFWQIQDTKPISIGGSPSHSQSPEAPSRIRDGETQETEAGKSLNEKLTWANGPNDSSPQHGQLPPPEVLTNAGDADMQDSVKSLSEKLSAALLTISAKEDLVKQHAKVAEDAVAGIVFFMLDCMLVSSFLSLLRITISSVEIKKE